MTGTIRGITVEEGKRLVIQTPRLNLRPIRPDDLGAYQKLFNNAVDTTSKFTQWLERWTFHPFSALAVVSKKTKEVIGHAILDHGDDAELEAGWSELSIVIDPRYWSQPYKDESRGIGTQGVCGIEAEVVRAMIVYAKYLKAYTYCVPVDVTAGQRVTNGEKGSAVAWDYAPFTEVRVAVNCYSLASRKIAQIIIREFQAAESEYPADPTKVWYAVSL